MTAVQGRDYRSSAGHPVSLEDVLLESSIHDAGGKVTRGELPSVMGDRSQLVQLTQNLIGNGLKYHGENPPRIHVSAKLDGGGWLLSVHDNGIGIATKHHERIFEIFKRLHDQQEYPRTGIGLFASGVPNSAVRNNPSKRQLNSWA